MTATPAARPTLGPGQPAATPKAAPAKGPPPRVLNEIVLAAVGLKKHFPVKGGFLQRAVAEVRAVDGVDLAIHRGETVALVGESGCGKTTLGRLLLRLIEPSEGDVLFNAPASVVDQIMEPTRAKDGAADALLERYSITRVPRRRVKPIRRHMQPVFQDPFTSLDPRMLVKDIIAEPILINGLTTKEEAEDRAAALIRQVGLRPEHLYRFPHEFSGGQRQRIAVARALAPDPEFLLLDEPTSALDVSVQAQILNLLKDIQSRQRLTYLLITHNLSVVRQMADRVEVMYLGKVAEEAPTMEIFANPLHPYTKALLSAVPVPDPKRRRDRLVLAGDVPSPIDPPAGCRFHTRCPAVFERCGWEPRDMGELAAFIFDSSRNPEASSLPPLKDVQLSDTALRLDFAGAATEAHRKIVEQLVDERRVGPKAPLFRAIDRVVLKEGALILEFLKPQEPLLAEVSKGHRVACFLFPESFPPAAA